MLDSYMPTSSSAFLQVFLLQLPQLTVNWTTSVLIIRVTNIYRRFSPLGGAANKIICYLNFIHQCDIDVSSETANQCAKQSKSNHATPLRLDLPFRETRHDYTCFSAIIFTMDGNDANLSHEPHQMRITSHGKMHDFVQFALNHFKVCL